MALPRGHGASLGRSQSAISSARFAPVVRLPWQPLLNSRHQSHMEYYLLIAGKSQGPFDEFEVVTAFQEGDIDETAQIRSAAGGEWMPVRQILPGYEASPAPAARVEGVPTVAAVVSRRPALSPHAYLKLLRETTCYQILRTVIDVAAVLAAVSVLLWWMAPLAALAMHQRLWIVDPTIGS